MLPEHARGKLENPDCLIIFFHAYGDRAARAADEMEKLLSPLMPNAKILCPEGPLPVPGQPPDGLRSWFRVDDMTEQNIDSAICARRALAMTNIVNSYIDHAILREKMPPSRVIIAGFSQGGTMAVYAGEMRAAPVAGLFSLSGGAIDQLPDAHVAMPVFLAAGEYERHPYSGCPQVISAAQRFRAAGVPVGEKILPGLGHVMSGQAAQTLADFAKKILPPFSPTPKTRGPSL